MPSSWGDLGSRWVVVGRWWWQLKRSPISTPRTPSLSRVVTMGSTYEAVGRGHEAHPHWRQRRCTGRGLVQPAVLRASGHELGAQRLGVRMRWWTLRSVTW